MSGRLVFVSATLFAVFAAFAELACGEGRYQSTRNGKTLVWNSDAKPGDAATWSGNRDRNDYAKGFGRLTWYTLERGSDEPQLYARYWGRMVNGKLDGPVNVHAKKKTLYAIFIDGNRVTRWTPGTAPLGATARWQVMVAKQGRTNRELASAEELRRDEPVSDEHLRRGEPEAPAAGPADQSSDDSGQKSATEWSIADIYNERWPKVDIDDSLRLLVFPPRSLRR